MKKTPKRLKVKEQVENEAQALIKHLRRCLRGAGAIFGPFIHKSKRRYYIRSDADTSLSIRVDIRIDPNCGGELRDGTRGRVHEFVVTRF